MAAGSATKRGAAVEVITDARGVVRIIEDGKVRTLRAGSKRDPGLWDPDVEFVLQQAESVLGLRGATGAVISMIEHGGAGGALQHDEAMLRRVGCIEGSKVPVRRARELLARWQTVPREHQRTLVAHHLLTLRVDHRIGSRCGIMAGVVAWQWLEANGEKRAHQRAQAVERLRAELVDKKRALRAEERAYDRDREADDGPARRFRGRARYWLTWHASGRLDALRRLRTEVGALAAREVALRASGGYESDLEPLTKVCEDREVPELMAVAEAAVRAANAAWQATGRRAAEAWVEA